MSGEHDWPPAPLEGLQDGIRQVTSGDADRVNASRAAEVPAREIASKLPLVHRTVDAEPSWRTILADGRLRPTAPAGDGVRGTIGPAVYFFLGYPAYDNGQVGIVIDPAATLTRDARFSPFDSGGLDTVKGTDRPHLVPTTPRPWAAADRLALLRELSGKGTDLPGYSALFLAAHFHEPRDYMRLGQRSDPDWPAYHGLAADDRDRRAWTVEVRVQEEVPLAASAGLRRILLADPRLRKSVAAAAEDLLDLVAVTRDEPGADDGERMATAIRRLLADQGVAT